MMMRAVVTISILLGLTQIGFAQKEIPMSTEKGNITLLYDDIITNGAFSTLQGSIRNDTPNALTSLVFEVVAYDQNGADLRMCDAYNTGSRCEFQVSTRLQTGQSVQIDPLHGMFHPSRVIPKKQHPTRVEWRVVAAQFAPLPVIIPDPKLSFTPKDGDIVVWDITFIRTTDSTPELSFRLANHTPYLGSDTAPGLSGMIRIRLQADGLCEGQQTQWVSDANWLRPHNFKYYKAVWTTTTKAAIDACEVRSFKGQLVLDADSALSDSYQFPLPLRIDAVGEPVSGSNVLVFHIKDRIQEVLAQQAADKLVADAAKAEQNAKAAAEAEKQRIAAEEQAAIDHKKALVEAARRKQVAAEQKRKQAEADARYAKIQAEEAAKAAEEHRRIRAACSVIYQNTVDKKISNLTVREEQQVRACQALGLYPPE